MAIGDDALAAGLDLVAGTVLANTIDTEINKSRDYTAQDRVAVRSVARGGTGSNTAAGARTNLGAAATSHTHTFASITGKPSAYTPAAHTHSPNDLTSAVPVTKGGTGGTSKDSARRGLGVTVSSTAPGGPAVGDVWIRST